MRRSGDRPSPTAPVPAATDERSAEDLSLRELVREDLRAHGGDITAAGFHTMLVHRLGVRRRRLPAWTHHPVALVYKVLFTFVRNVYGIELHDTATVGRRVVLGHQSGIVLHPYIEIGDDSLIRQNVTIASTGAPGGAVSEVPPRIGRRVEVGAGAVVFGRVSIGDDARIGPGVVLTRDVPAGAMVFATPPRIITRLPSEAAARAPEGDEGRQR